MPSPAKKTETIRNRKRASQGRKRKAKARTEGTTRSKEELFGDE